MIKAKSFTFEAYNIEDDRKSITFDYLTMLEDGKEVAFRDKIVLPEAVPPNVSEILLDRILQNLHLVLGLSYWKLYCPPRIIINSMKLSRLQARFWNTVYTKGLGEFFYRNGIDFTGLIDFPWAQESASSAVAFSPSDRSLVGIGGGKDSIVTVELLKKAGKMMSGLSIETNKDYPLISEVMQYTGISHMAVKRTLDEKLITLNQNREVYNGHVPVSAMYAFIGIMISVLYDFRYFVVSNEKSASYGNVTYHGFEINHQWSKSEEFETLFNNYLKEFITTGVTYFSLLRPFWEIQIVRIFSQYPKYFRHFSSCNKNFRVVSPLSGDNRWCGTCAKCAFIFSMLSAFLPKKELVAIFGKNLYADKAILDLYRELLGVRQFKPFDCVGTPEEVKAALYLASKKDGYEKDSVMEMFVREVLPDIKDVNALTVSLFQPVSYDTIPVEFVKAATL